ncbi:MAG: hypothetical protein V8Q30_01500 [Acutalibacteraceae bacterium]
MFVVLIKDRISAFSTDNGIIVEGLCFLIVTGILLTLACQRPIPARMPPV